MGSFKDIIIKIGDFFSNYGINIVAAILVFIIGYFLCYIFIISWL